MALNLTGINEWVNESADRYGIVYKAFIADPSLDYFEKYVDVKGEKLRVPIFSIDGTANNSLCSTTDTDNLAIEQFELNGNVRNYRNSICLPQLDSYFTKQYHEGDSLTILDDLFTKLIVLKVISKSKKYAWLSNTAIATLSSDYKDFDGLLAKIDASSSVYTKTLGSGKVLGTTNNTTTEAVDTILDDLIANLPEEAKQQDLVAFMGPTVFEYLKTIIKSSNQYHYKVEDLLKTPYIMTYPAHPNLTIVSTEALSNNAVTGQDNSQKDRIVLTTVNNLAIGMDFETIKNTFRIVFNEVDDNLIFKWTYWIATGFKFANFIATCKRS